MASRLTRASGGCVTVQVCIQWDHTACAAARGGWDQTRPRAVSCWDVQRAGNWRDKELLGWRCWGCLAWDTLLPWRRQEGGGGEDRGTLKGVALLRAEGARWDTQLWLVETRDQFSFQHYPNKPNLLLQQLMCLFLLVWKSGFPRRDGPCLEARGAAEQPQSVNGVLLCPDPLQIQEILMACPFPQLSEGWLAES